MCCTGTRNPLGSLTPVAQPVSQKTSRGRGETEQRWTKQLGQRTSSSWSPNLTEPKTHGGREREVTATNNKEKGHARPWQAALARTMKTTTGHGELFPAERTSRPPGPHGQALLGLDSHKSRSAPAAGCERWLRRGAARRRPGLQRCFCEGRGQELHCHGQHRTGAPTWRPSTKNRTLRTARGASEKSQQPRPKLHDSFPNFAQMKFSLVQTYP